MSLLHTVFGLSALQSNDCSRGACGKFEGSLYGLLESASCSSIDQGVAVTDAAALLAAVARDVLTDVTEAAVLELSWGRERHVKTDAGSRMYHAPIGTLITFHMRQKAREHNGTAAEAKVHAQQASDVEAKGQQAAHKQPELSEAGAVFPGVRSPIRRPGDTISGHAYKHVPKPAPVMFQPPVEEPQTRELVSPFGTRARVTNGEVETLDILGNWQKVEDPHFREQVLASWQPAEPSKGAEAGAKNVVSHAVLEHFTSRAEAAASKRYTLPDHKGPLTDQEVKDRLKFVERSSSNALYDGRGTDYSQALDAPNSALGWIFKPKRVKQHRAIVKDLMKKYKDVPRDGRGLISGGVPGAGKTTVIKSLPEKYMLIDADEIKTEMAKRGMVPKLHGLTPMEAAPLVHEESRQIAALLAHAAYDEHRNVAYDITMAGAGTPLKHLDAMRKAGYGDVRAMYTQVDPKVAVQRTRDRYRIGLEDWRAGKNELGPRYIASSTVTGNASGSQQVFNNIKDKFDGSDVYDTTNGKPKLISHYTPLSDAEYAQHVQKAEDAIAHALAAGQSTDKTQVLSPGVWKPDRAELHNDIVRKMLKRSVGVPSQGKAIISGGLPGAGKTTVLSKYAGVNPHDYLTLNADDIKEEMAKRGMVPEVKGLTAMEATPLVHEEASHITSLIAHQAYERKKNVIWDITMSSPGSVHKRLNEMRAMGYHDLRAVFVHIPVETSIQRARDRHRRGTEAFRQGHGNGGRLLPSGLIRSTETANGSNASHDTFENLKNDFDGYKEFDNSGRKPKLVSEHSPPARHASVMSAEEIVRRIRSWGREEGRRR